MTIREADTSGESASGTADREATRPDDDDPWFGPRISRAEVGGIALISLLYVVLVFDLVSDSAPLGWDEATYALRARNFFDHTFSTGWNDYRAPGLPAVMSPFVGMGDTALRSITACFGLIGIGATWLVGRILFGQLAGVIAAAGLTLTPTWLSSSTQIWPDVPGASLGVVVTAVAIIGTRGGIVRWWTLAAAPIAMAATFLRFGAPIPIGIVLVAIGLWRLRTFVRFPGRTILLIASLAASVYAVLMVPFLTGSIRAPLSALRQLRDQNAFPLVKGFTDYSERYREIFGDMGILVVLLGLGLAITARKMLGGRIGITAVAGLVTAVALATILHGELRYLSPALPLVWLGVAGGLAVAGGHLPRRYSMTIAGLFLIAMLSGAMTYANDMNEWLYRWGGLRTVSEEIGASVRSSSCVVLTMRYPVVAWYSGCEARPYDVSNGLPDNAEWDADELFLLLIDGVGALPNEDQLVSILGEAREPDYVNPEPESGSHYPVAAYRLGD